MTQDPEQLRAEIDRTRTQMSNDVNALTDYVAPSNVAHRQADKVKGKVTGAVTSVKEKVMGTASDLHDTASSRAGHVSGSVSGTVHDATSSVQGAASSVHDAAAAAPARVTSGTRGNPLAAGLIALGAGWLLGSLLPASAKERQAAEALKENASTLARPLTEAAKDAASNLKEPAQEAVQSVKETAADAAGTVKDEGTSAAQHVQGRAQEAKGTVQDARS